jgi:hypothetical protein
MLRHRRHLTYANVMASAAVFIALGGSSYAAVVLSKDSVRSRHIADGQVKRADLARNAVTSRAVKDGALLARDFRAGQLPAGAAGPQGPQGAKGDPGRDFTPQTVLPPGALLVGHWAVGGGAGDWMGTSVNFRIPLAAAVPGANAHHIEGTAFTPECPATEDAAPGHLCVYTKETGGTSTFSAIYHNLPDSTAGASREGFNLFFSATANLSYRSGTWAVRAP